MTETSAKREPFDVEAIIPRKDRARLALLAAGRMRRTKGGGQLQKRFYTDDPDCAKEMHRLAADQRRLAELEASIAIATGSKQVAADAAFNLDAAEALKEVRLRRKKP